MRAKLPTPAALLALLAAGALLTGCGVGAAAETPTWVPKPSFNGENGPPAQLPSPSPSNSPTPPGPNGQPSPGAPAPTSTGANDPNVVATDLSAPIGVSLLPDGSALVGERTTGRVLHVQKDPGQPVVVVRTLPGLDASGDGGLLDLAVSPTYGEDGLVYAYVTTATDNRVLVFTLHGAVTPVVIGIPRGTTGNTGRLFFGHDGDLYIGTGAAGNPAFAADPASLAGKVLRVTDIGQPAPGNPTPSSPIYASGYQRVDGLCGDDTGLVYAVQSEPDVVSVVRPNGTEATTTIGTLPSNRAGAGGCAVIGKQLFVASRDGQALLSGRVGGPAATPQLGPLTAALDKTYGRLATVVLAPDGALWLTTTNKDGHGTPKPHDEKVLRIQPPTSGGGGAPPV